MKKRCIRQLVSAILCVILLLTAFPLTGSAASHYNLYIVYPDIQAKRNAGSSPYGGNTTDYYRQRLPFDGNYQCVYLAQNEMEGFQLFFYEWYDPRELHVTVSDFVNTAGEKLPHTVYREEYFTSTNVENFPLADPLIPYYGEAVQTAPQENRMFYVQLHSAKDQTPGVYTATITVSDENGTLTTRYIKATVWNFALPESHYATTIAGLYNSVSGYGSTNGFLRANGVRFNGSNVVEEDLPLAERILEGWQEVLLQHGITTYELPRYLIDSDPKAAQLAMADTRRKAFAVPLLSYSVTDGSFNAQTVAKIEQYKALVQSNTYLEDKAFFYVADEPGWNTEEDAAVYNARISAIQSVWPDYHAVVPMAGQNDFVLGKLRDSADILCLNQDILHHSAAYRTAFTDGTWHRTWRYQGNIQDGGFYFHRWGKSTMGVFSRILYWQASALGSDGILHWNAAYLPNDTDGAPYDVWAHMAIPPQGGSATGNGDGILVYPGSAIGLDETKPVETLRLKQISDGMDDYDYLTLAKEFLGEEKWAEYISKVLSKFSKSGIENIYCSEEGIDWVAWECVTMNNARVAIGNALSGATTTHTYGDWTTVVEPDDSHDGLQIRSCSTCGAQESRALTSHVHVFGEWTQTAAPTCVKAGAETRTCSSCGVTETREVAATGHMWSQYAGDPVTCTDGTKKTRTCSVCGRTETVDVAALGHDFGEWLQTDAGCTTDGEKSRTCARCGYTETEVLPATGHNFGEWTLTKETTCTENGERTRTCATCGDAQTETLPAPGHDYDAVIVEPTCTGDGYTKYSCSRCGSEYTAHATAALGHDWDDGIVTREPTTAEEGIKTFTCARCGETQTEAIPKILTTPKFCVSSSKAYPGKTVQVTVDISENPGIVSAMLHLHYDPQVLTLTAVDNGDVFGEDVFQSSGNLAHMPFNVFWIDALATENNTKSGTLVTFTFTVSPDAAKGATQVAVTYDENSTFDKDLQNIAFEIENTEIEIAAEMPGDVNGDGTVDLKDAVIIRRYLAGGWNVRIYPANADVDADGSVTLADAVQIARFLAGGWGVVLK